MSVPSLLLRVTQIVHETPAIRVFELMHPEGNALPAFSAGAHIDVHIPGGAVRQYSLWNSPAETHRYMIAVLDVAGGRGGSRAMHRDIRVGQTLEVSGPRNHFPLSMDAGRYLFLAGGIGVTPILAMIDTVRRAGKDFSLVYCTRSPQDTPFRELLSGLPGRVRLHHDGGDPARSLDIAALLSDHAAGTELYCCGPRRFMDAVSTATARWPADAVHFEDFSPPALADAEADQAFTVEIASTGDRYEVPPEKTILEVLREAGMVCDSSCEAGLCGVCCIPYNEGTVIHRDSVLTQDERAGQLAICCSRAAAGSVLKLDL